MTHSNQLNGSPPGISYDTHYRCRNHGWYPHQECTDKHGEISCPYIYPDRKKCLLKMRTRRAYSNHGKPRPWKPSTPIHITTP